MLPAAVIFSIVHETGPIVTGLVVSGRVGAGIGAELGSMKATEQIDAIEASGVCSYKLLAFTRILACVLMLPLLTLAADGCGVVVGWIADALVDPISFHRFLHLGLHGTTFSDFLAPTFRTTVFGLIIGVIACFQGMNTSGGTAGVGLSATSSVVLSSLFVILADVILVKLILVFFP
jgi:phospholipid/cholesterol/gamma-HCH transport system permease protein